MERSELESIIRATGASEECGGYVFLRDPFWSATQQAAFVALKAKHAHPAQKSARGWLCIPTGGSSGGLKFARHDEQTLSAAVRGFCEHFNLKHVNAIDVLPPWHVSGLMARVRCAATGGKHVAWDWKRLEAGDFPEVSANEPWVLSLVPTQLQRLLKRPAACAWLKRLHLIFLGGGPVWPALAEAANAAEIPVVLSYGMTETAAMVAAQQPEDFRNGDRSSGKPMPHARITLDDENVVCITGESVMRGYLGEPDLARGFRTADRGNFDEQGNLHIAGRRDEVAITGGEKVNLSEVEAVLRGLPGFEEVAVIAVPHAEWGEAVTACYLGAKDAAFDQVINSHLLRHQCPKYWLAFAPEEWPRNAQGKLNRAALRAAALARINPSRQS